MLESHSFSFSGNARHQLCGGDGRRCSTVIPSLSSFSQVVSMTGISQVIREEAGFLLSLGLGQLSRVPQSVFAVDVTEHSQNSKINSTNKHLLLLC